MLNKLFKLTQLQTSFAINMVALVDGVPRTLNLTQALAGYVAHQVEVITRRSQFRLGKARDREHILEGRIKALDVIDEVIALIRASDDAAAAKAGPDGRAVRVQRAPGRRHPRHAAAPADPAVAHRPGDRAGRRPRTHPGSSRRSSPTPQLLRSVIKDELLAVKEGFATPRVCQITLDSGDMSIEDLVDDKELVVVMTEAQYVKAVPAGSFKTQARGGRGVAGARLKADDLVRHVIFTTAHAHLLFFSNLGKVYRLRALEIPERERTAKGMPIVNLLPLQPGEKIQAIIDTRDFAGERFLFFATRQGTVKKTAFDAYDSSRRDGLIALNLRPGDELVRVIETGGGDDIFMVSRKGMTIRFNEDDVRPMGRTAAGVRGHEAARRRRGRLGRRRPRRHGDPDGHRGRLRQAHPARALQHPGPRRPGCHRHQAHRPQGSGRRRLHGRHRRRDRRRLLQRHRRSAWRCARSPRRVGGRPACG